MTDRSDSTNTSINQHLAWIQSARLEAAAAMARASLPACAEARAVPSDSEARLVEMLSADMPGYEFGETISRGGQGIVMRAVQKATGRDVAIKVLRTGHLASENERVRFFREVRILAQLRHPHIVTVHDSGVAAGLHYFVMDYIHGWPLDEYVRERKLSIRARLELFVKICDAVNVAHLRGIIHRDLKPGNVRVDAAGEPHVLDFGLAKVDEQDTLANTKDAAITVAGQFLGSLPWAAPEQFSGRSETIDLRTDVYSLGVMFYQLVTGLFPYDVSGKFSDAVRNICNEEPRRPSLIATRIDDDVDQMILKCLRKEPDGRYENAGALAREIRRYLSGEPIEAKRDSGWYLMRKALHRHRVTATVVGLTLLLIVTTTISLALLYHRERAITELERSLRVEAQEARQQAIDARLEAERQGRIKSEVNHFFSGEVLAAASPERLGPSATIAQAMDAAAGLIDESFRDDPIVAGEIHLVLGATYLGQGNYDKAQQHYAASLRQFRDRLGADHEATISVGLGMARLHEQAGRFELAEREFVEGLAALRRRLGESHVEVHEIECNLGWLYARLGRWDDSEALCRRATEGLMKLVGSDHPDTLNSMNNLAMILMETGRADEAEPLLKSGLEAARRVFGPDNPSTLVSMGNLAQLYARLDRLDDAIAMSSSCLDARRKVYGGEHPSTLLMLNNLAMLHARKGDADKASEFLAEAYEIANRSLEQDHPTRVSITSNLGALRDRQGRHAEAEPLHREALNAARAYLPEGHAYIGLYHSRLGQCLASLGRGDEAAVELRAGQKILSASPGEERNAREAQAALDQLEQSRGVTTESPPSAE
ncbi:MAG: serine/threonine protein kinase [Phycisphaerae bacterium]|nr:serine/threonine protein kinase [Phycisphaerae bacterium]